MSDRYDSIALFYDFHPNETDREDVDFYVEEARNAGRVLEVGCGSGRVTVPMARSGAEVFGVDLSEGMLRRCRERLEAEPQAVQARVRLRQADMRHFELGERFPLIVVPFRPFQHLETVVDQLACLDCLRDHLAPGGRLILDLYNPDVRRLGDDYDQPFQDGPTYPLGDGREVTRYTTILEQDLFEQVTRVRMDYHVHSPDGETQVFPHTFSMRYLFRFEAEHLLARAGLRLLEIYSDYRRSAYGTRYPGELLMLAEASGDRGGAGWSEEVSA